MENTEQLDGDTGTNVSEHSKQAPRRSYRDIELYAYWEAGDVQIDENKPPSDIIRALREFRARRGTNWSKLGARLVRVLQMCESHATESIRYRVPEEIPSPAVYERKKRGLQRKVEDMALAHRLVLSEEDIESIKRRCSEELISLGAVAERCMANKGRGFQNPEDETSVTSIAKMLHMFVLARGAVENTINLTYSFLKAEREGSLGNATTFEMIRNFADQMPEIQYTHSTSEWKVKSEKPDRDSDGNVNVTWMKQCHREREILPGFHAMLLKARSIIRATTKLRNDVTATSKEEDEEKKAQLKSEVVKEAQRLVKELLPAGSWSSTKKVNES